MKTRVILNPYKNGNNGFPRTFSRIQMKIWLIRSPYKNGSNRLFSVSSRVISCCRDTTGHETDVSVASVSYSTGRSCFYSVAVSTRNHVTMITHETIIDTLIVSVTNNNRGTARPRFKSFHSPLQGWDFIHVRILFINLYYKGIRLCSILTGYLQRKRLRIKGWVWRWRCIERNI